MCHSVKSPYYHSHKKNETIFLSCIERSYLSKPNASLLYRCTVLVHVTVSLLFPLLQCKRLKKTCSCKNTSQTGFHKLGFFSREGAPTSGFRCEERKSTSLIREIPREAPLVKNAVKKSVFSHNKPNQCMWNLVTKLEEYLVHICSDD